MSKCLNYTTLNYGVAPKKATIIGLNEDRHCDIQVTSVKEKIQKKSEVIRRVSKTRRRASALRKSKFRATA